MPFGCYLFAQPDLLLNKSLVHPSFPDLFSNSRSGTILVSHIIHGNASMIFRCLSIAFHIVHGPWRRTAMGIGIQDDPGSTICRRLMLGYPPQSGLSERILREQDILSPSLDYRSKRLARRRQERIPNELSRRFELFPWRSSAALDDHLSSGGIGPFLARRAAVFVSSHIRAS